MNELARLFEAELAAAHAHLDRKEAELDAYGYGGRPKRHSWRASFAFNLYESLLAIGAIR